VATVAGYEPVSNGRYKDHAAAGLGGVDLTRLVSAVRRSRRVLEYFRQERRAAVQKFVGAHWSSGGSDRIVPVNVLARYVQVVGRSLVAREPRLMLSTMRRDMKPAVDAMMRWANQRIVQMQFAETLRRFATDALFSVACMKVGIASPHDEAVAGYAAPTGVPFADVVDLDDLAFDAGASRLDRASFVAHRFRLPYDVAKKMKYFSASARRLMRPAEVPEFNEEGDERIGKLGRGYQTDGTEDFEEQVEFWEVYLPRHKKVVTLLSDDGHAPVADADPARVIDYFGPACGPYHFLGFGTVPGNAMPKAPVMDLVDLHDLVNRLYRKLGNQAERQKSVLPVSGGQLDDGKQLIQAGDGEAFACDNPAAVKEVTYGGPNPANLQFAVHCSDVFNEQGGNLRLFRGRRRIEDGQPGQDAQPERLRGRGRHAGRDDVRDPQGARLPVLVLVEPPPGGDEGQPLRPGRPRRRGRPRAAPGRRRRQGAHPNRGRFEDIELRVDPYSMQYKSPQMRRQALSNVVKEMLPLLPLLEKQGVTINLQFLLKKYAEYEDEPDYLDLFSVGEPPATVATGGGGPGARRAPRVPGAPRVHPQVGRPGHRGQPVPHDAERPGGRQEIGEELGAGSRWSSSCGSRTPNTYMSYAGGSNAALGLAVRGQHKLLGGDSSDG
jgi:hypothetical protein